MIFLATLINPGDRDPGLIMLRVEATDIDAAGVLVNQHAEDRDLAVLDLDTFDGWRDSLNGMESNPNPPDLPEPPETDA